MVSKKNYDDNFAQFIPYPHSENEHSSQKSMKIETDTINNVHKVNAA